MRVALVVAGGFDPSGRERVTPNLLWLVERLARRHAVHVFVLQYYPDPCSYPLLGATVHDIGGVGAVPGLRRAAQRRRLAAALGARRPFDVLHAYQGMPAIVAAPLARRLRVPLVATLDSGDLTTMADIGYGLQRRGFDRRALASAVHSAARVTVSTAFMAAMMPEGHSREPVAIAPIGVDTSVFPPGARADGPPWRLLRVASINHVKDLADSHLAVDQQDLFTANQIIHLRPLAGGELMERFRAANPFVERCYPNSGTRGAAAPLADVRLGGLGLVTRALEALLSVPAPLVETVCRHAYAWHLRRRAGSWRSPDQVRLHSDYLKLHTRSHRHAVLDRFQATVDTLVRMAKTPRCDDLFEIFPDLPGLRKRTAAEQVERVHRQVQDTRERAGENILRQQAASARVRAAIAGRRRH